MKAAIMTKRQEAGKREMQLASNTIVFGLGDAPEQVIDDTQQFELF